MGDNYKLSVKEAAAIIGISRSTVMEHINDDSLRALRDTPEDRAAAGYHGPLRWRVCSHDVLAFREYSAEELNAMQKYFDAPVDLAYIDALLGVEYIDQMSAKLARNNTELKKENAQLEEQLKQAKATADIKVAKLQLRTTQLCELFGENIILLNNPSGSRCTEDIIAAAVEERKQQIAALQSTIAADTERIKDLESYSSILKDDLKDNASRISKAIHQESYSSILKADLESRDQYNINLTAEKGRLEKYADKVNLEIIERDEKIIQLQGQIDEAVGKIAALEGQISGLKIQKSTLSSALAVSGEESHKRGLKIKELLGKIKQLEYVLRETEHARDGWRELYEDLDDNQPVSIWQKIAWVFNH